MQEDFKVLTDMSHPGWLWNTKPLALQDFLSGLILFIFVLIASPIISNGVKGMHSMLAEKKGLSQDHGEWSDFLRLLISFINSYSLPYIQRNVHFNIKSFTCITDEKNVVKIQQEISLWDLLWVCTSTKHLL